MLTCLYIEALLVDPDAADDVWWAWNAGEIGNLVAAWAWLVASDPCLSVADD